MGRPGSSWVEEKWRSLAETVSKGSSIGRHTIIDLDLSKYDRLATRFAKEQQQTLDFLKSGMATKNKRFNRSVASPRRNLGRVGTTAR